MVMSLCSAFYTFKNARYMYKRLAAGLFFIAGMTQNHTPNTALSINPIISLSLTASCNLVVLEVMVTLVRYSSSNLPWSHPPTSSYSYGFSFYLGWLVFTTFLGNGALFLALSRKRKGNREIHDNEGQITGR